MSLNYKTYFKNFQKLKHYLYLQQFNLFSFKESSILTIKYVFQLFLVFKMYKSGLQVIHLNSDNLIFLGSVDIGAFLQWHNLKVHFSLLVIFQMLILICKLCKWALYIATYFEHGQCFILAFLVMTFIETAGLNTTSFSNFSWSGNDIILVYKLYMSSLKLKSFILDMLEILCSFCLIYFLTDFQPCIRNSTFGYFLEIAETVVF